MKKLLKSVSTKQLKTMHTRSFVLKLLIFIIFSASLFVSCKKESETDSVEPSVNLALDSIRATKKSIVVWEQIYITAYARGKNLSFAWKANHGSMTGKDSVTVKYWACPSCVGLNTIECKVSNEYGSVSDTIMIRVNK